MAARDIIDALGRRQWQEANLSIAQLLNQKLADVLASERQTVGIRALGESLLYNDEMPLSEVDRVFHEIGDEEATAKLCGISKVVAQAGRVVDILEGTDIAADTSGPIFSTRQRRVNAALYNISKTYYDHIPLDAIFAILKTNGFTPVQEDGTDWSGLLLGRDATMNVDLRIDGLREKSTVRRSLTLSWHKMDVTGKFEITAYVS